MSSLDLRYGEVEEELRRSVRDLLAHRSPWPAVLARVEGAQPYDPDLWAALARDLGVAGLLVPEDLGGAGASAREAAVVLEELGRAAAPTPYLGSAVLATTALLGAPVPEAAKMLGDLAAGDRTATLAVPLSTAPGAAFPASVTTGGAVLSGTVRSVADLVLADTLVVPAVDADGRPGLYLADPAGPGTTVVAVPSLDLTRRLADLTLAETPAVRLADGAAAEAGLDRALQAGAGLLAAEQLGVAAWCLETTVTYVKGRYQFGRPVGSFQAVKHRLADVWATVSTARATSRAAADALARDADDAEVLVAVAAAYGSDAAVRAAEECIQLHGGIGMTWEHPAHLYLGRAKADQIALGTPDRHRMRLADLVALPG